MGARSSSRLFLQLAEEYRRAGDLPESIRVLEAGLRRQPAYLSAQVALGRCYLENGQATQACRVLEAVVGQDPTQLVAQKLLVEAYLQVGEAAKARASLDLYRLFNNRDQEIEKLERRIRGLSGEVARPAAIAETPARPAPPPIAAPIFDLEPVDLPTAAQFEPPARAVAPVEAPAVRVSPRMREPFGTIHDPEAAGRAILARFALEEIFAAGENGSAAAAAIESQPFFEDTAVGWQPDSEIVRGADELAWISSSTVEPAPAVPFESSLLESREAVELEPASEVVIEREPEPALAAWEPMVEPETLYGDEAAPTVEEPEAAEAAVEEPVHLAPAAAYAPITEPQPSGEETVFAPAAGAVEKVRIGVGVPTISLPLPTLAPETPVTAMPEMAEPETATPETATPEAATPEPHSTTLGELYLAQGHIAEARSHFEAVISEQPSAESARRGLFQTLEPAAVAAAAPETLGLTQRKVLALRGYLDRLRRLVRARVS